MSSLWRLPPAEARKMLVLGAIAVRARKRREAEARQPSGHPFPDLTGQPVEAIVSALISTIVAAHRDDPTDASADPSCASCIALIDLASHYGDPTHMEWPDPVKRYLADLIDDELARRREGGSR